MKAIALLALLAVGTCRTEGLTCPDGPPTCPVTDPYPHPKDHNGVSPIRLDEVKRRG
jgi:hypothetical protein